MPSDVCFSIRNDSGNVTKQAPVARKHKYCQGAGATSTDDTGSDIACKALHEVRREASGRFVAIRTELYDRR